MQEKKTCEKSIQKIHVNIVDCALFLQICFRV